MAPVGYIEAKLNTIGTILKKIDLLEEINHFPKVVPNPAETFRRMSYIEIWKYCVNNSIYNFQLSDSSIIHFNSNVSYPSFVFYGCPYDSLTYKDFIREYGFEYDEIGDELSNDYTQYLDSCSFISSPRTLRYDYDPKNYNEGLHPASHMHVGHYNNIRLGLDKILDPIAFVLFVIRQLYPNNWKVLIDNHSNEKFLCKYKNDLQSIEPNHFNKKDHWEYYLK